MTAERRLTGVYIIRDYAVNGGGIVGVYSSKELAEEIQRAMSTLTGQSGELVYYPVWGCPR